MAGVEELKRLHASSFDTKAYEEAHRNYIYSNQPFFLRNILDAFRSGHVEGKRCLEIGAGPIVYNVASASKFCDEIYYSDFLEKNRTQLQLWIADDPAAFNWDHIFKLIARLEKYSNYEEGAKEIEHRLRSKVKGVVYCDVTNEYPLEERMEPFDVVITSACLEGATTTHEDYANAVKNVGNLLKPKGKLIMVGFSSSYYTLNDVRFPTAKVEENVLRKSYDSAGLRLLEYKEQPMHDDFGADTEKCFFCLSEKL